MKAMHPVASVRNGIAHNRSVFRPFAGTCKAGNNSGSVPCNCGLFTAPHSLYVKIKC